MPPSLHLPMGGVAKLIMASNNRHLDLQPVRKIRIAKTRHQPKNGNGETPGERGVARSKRQPIGRRSDISKKSMHALPTRRFILCWGIPITSCMSLRIQKVGPGPNARNRKSMVKGVFYPSVKRTKRGFTRPYWRQHGYCEAQCPLRYPETCYPEIRSRRCN